MLGYWGRDFVSDLQEPQKFGLIILDKVFFSSLLLPSDLSTKPSHSQSSAQVLLCISSQPYIQLGLAFNTSFELM